MLQLSSAGGRRGPRSTGRRSFPSASLGRKLSSTLSPPDMGAGKFAAEVAARLRAHNAPFGQRCPSATQSWTPRLHVPLVPLRQERRPRPGVGVPRVSPPRPP
eukprot:2014831-Alexandrium_andersonii.AAC.1